MKINKINSIEKLRHVISYLNDILKYKQSDKVANKILNIITEIEDVITEIKSELINGENNLNG